MHEIGIGSGPAPDLAIVMITAVFALLLAAVTPGTAYGSHAFGAADANENQPSSQAGVREICSAQSASQVAFGECLATYVAQSAARLADVERGAAAWIDQWDEDAGYPEQARAALATSNAAFARYRTRECDFAAALAGGSIGTAHHHLRLACTYELNISRAASLGGFVASLPQRGT